MPGIYPDKPPEASNGRAFEALGCWLHLHFLREVIEVYQDGYRQRTIGESRQRVEFKELKKSTQRFHIEVAERVSVRLSWWPSGIMREDNTIRYVCGNEYDIFVFRKTDLLQWREINQPREVWYGKDCGITDSEHPLATIRSFVLPKNEAWIFCLYRFRFMGDQWRMVVRDRNWMIGHLKEALGPLADTPLGCAEIERLIGQ